MTSHSTTELRFHHLRSRCRTGICRVWPVRILMLLAYSSGQSSMPLSSGVCFRSLRLVHIGNDDVAFNPNRSKQERICAQKDAQQWRASEATLAQSPGNETWPFAAVASSNTGILPLPMHHSKHISLLWILKLSHQLVSLGWWRRSTKMS